MKSSPRERKQTSLRSLMNVGDKVEGYLHDLGVRSVSDLARRSPDAMYRALWQMNPSVCDPCLHDTFSAIVHEAKTGEKTAWFAWTAERKRRVAAGELKLGA